MRILHTSDWHLGKNIEGKSRLDEQIQFLDDFVKIIEEKDVDLLIIAGDIYDTANPSAKAEQVFYDALKRISNHGKCCILVIAGNHDSPERLVAATPLAMEHGIIMVGTPKSIVPCGTYGHHQVIDSGEGYLELLIKDEKAMILCVPYPSEKRLNEVLYGEGEEDEDRVNTYGERIESLFKQLESHFRADTINLAVSHLFVFKSEEGGSERSIQLGGSMIVAGNTLPLTAQYIALGHVHKPQIVPNTHGIARYSGSILQYHQNEANLVKKCYLIDVHAGEKAEVSDILFKTYKPIEIWQCNSIDEAIQKCEANQERSCWVYLRIKTDRTIREDEIKLMKQYKEDILEVLPLLEQTEENEEAYFATERSFGEMFKAFYQKERGVEPDEEILECLNEILLEAGENHETN